MYAGHRPGVVPGTRGETVNKFRPNPACLDLPHLGQVETTQALRTLGGLGRDQVGGEAEKAQSGGHLS